MTACLPASCKATRPTALRVAEDNLRLPPSISRFVLTIGSTANQNGTALFEGLTVLFLAHFYGVPLSLGQQTLVPIGAHRPKSQGRARNVINMRPLWRCFTPT